MINFVRSLLILIGISLVATSYAFKLPAMDFEPIRNNVDDLILNKEYAPYQYSLIDAYRRDNKITDNDPMYDIKYRNWKRNADLINSLLALPKGMSDAGR